MGEKGEEQVTFEEKLEKFKSERVGFRVSSEDIADELAKVFTKEGMVDRDGSSPTHALEYCLTEHTEYPGVPYIAYNYNKGEHELSYGTDDFTDEAPIDLLDVTLEELKEYNG